MESGSEYGDEIQSPDEEEGNVEGDVNNDAGSIGSDVGEDAEDSRSTPVQKPNVEEDESTCDHRESDIRSPSIADSNTSDNEMEMQQVTPEPPIEEMIHPIADCADSVSKMEDVAQQDTEDVPANEEEDREVADDDEGSKSEKADEDKESSYHSTPPESPSSSPSSEAVMLSVNDNSHINNRSPKEAVEDQEGELDFEEEIPERKEDVESGGEQSKQGESIIEDVKDADDKEVGKVEDIEDDGEVEDDDDLEEGEVKDSSSARKMPQRPLCRFFTKGQCTWGTNCRFLHPGVNDKGNYSMFAPPKPLVPSNGPGIIGPGFGWHASGPRISPPFHARGFIEHLPPPPPPAFEEPVFESAWERGLRHAKEILKKSSKRKEMEPDFEEKRMNLSLGGGDGANEYEKENDYYNRSPYGHSGDPYGPYGYDDPALDPYERQAHDYWRGGNYENFEVRYMRTDYDFRDHERLRERERIRERDREREIFRDRERDRDPRGRRDNPERNWREERYVEPPIPNRARGDEWRDPWRRSTSPKRRNLSRSFSSHSSASYSSSRSSGSSSYSSRSRSSSASSHSSYSSRSYSHSRSHSKTPIKHKGFGAGMSALAASGLGIPMRKSRPLPQSHLPAPKASRAAVDKRPALPVPSPATTVPVVPPSGERKLKTEKVTPRLVKRERSMSSSASDSISSRSRSRVDPLGAWPQRKTRKSSHSGTSLSRSSSVSSLESVSSKSSISSKSSYDSEPKISHELRKKEKRLKEKVRLHLSDPAWKSSYEKSRLSKTDSQAADLRMKSMVNATRTSKDPLKQIGQKAQIKLTLLNKSQEKGVPAATKKEGSAETRKTKSGIVMEKEIAKPVKIETAPAVTGKKRPASPSHDGPDTTSVVAKVSSSSSRNSGAVGKTLPASSSSTVEGQNKKSTSCRREELLKQLKAVEDAIARKRAKLA